MLDDALMDDRCSAFCAKDNIVSIQGEVVGSKEKGGVGSRKNAQSPPSPGGGSGLTSVGGGSRGGEGGPR
jgi:hypothetical protein